MSSSLPKNKQSRLTRVCSVFHLLRRRECFVVVTQDLSEVVVSSRERILSHPLRELQHGTSLAFRVDRQVFVHVGGELLARLSETGRICTSSLPVDQLRSRDRARCERRFTRIGLEESTDAFDAVKTLCGHFLRLHKTLTFLLLFAAHFTRDTLVYTLEILATHISIACKTQLSSYYARFSY